jgi:hypothetical protein
VGPLPASAIIASVWDPTDRYAMRVLIGQPFHPALPSGGPRISAHIAVCWVFGPEFLLGSGLELVGRAD